ncbi:MAG: type II CRISPR-associated endonuclease Cas1 [Pseudomonadota bacterium]
MIGRIVEAAGEGRYLHMERGFLVAERHGAELGRVPLDDVAALIATAHGVVLSNNLLAALAERGAPVVVCGRNHLPRAVLWPLDAHHRQGARLDAQLAAGKPLRKRLWRDLVRSKLSMQAACLGAHGLPEMPLRALVSKVRAGDPGNLEGVGARRYWSRLLGRRFRRDPDGDGVNALLNYGYTVLRATVARHLVATGLHPGLPLHHANDGNAMRLVDDLMEPFRPCVDALVRQRADLGLYALDTADKREFALLMTRPIRTPDGRSPIANAIERLCQSLAQVYEGERKTLLLPIAEAVSLRDMLNAPASPRRPPRLTPRARRHAKEEE